MNKLWFVIAIIPLSSCATLGEWKFKGKMDDWIGQPIANVEFKYGNPARHIGSVYTYQFDFGERTDIYYNPNTYSGSAQTYEVACEINFTVAGEDEHVVAYQYRGTICRAKLFGSIY